MATAPRDTGAQPFFALSPAERATVAAELAGVRGQMTALAARLDRLQAGLAAPGGPARRTQMVAEPINWVFAVSAASGLVTASGARSWR